MAAPETIEAKAFVPARDYGLAQRFYLDLGFERVWADDHLAYFRAGPSSFLLQNFFDEVHAANFMMHLLVRDVYAWWSHVADRDIPGRYGVMAQPPRNHPGGMRDFVLVDPTGVLWRIAQGPLPG